MGGCTLKLEFESLRRWPDVEAENLQAFDAADRLLLDLAAEAGWPAEPGRVAILNDHYGALTLGALAAGVRSVRVHQDALSGARAIEANAQRLLPELAGEYRHLPLGAGLLENASLVLIQLPRSLDALEEMLAFVAEHASADVTVMATGRIKHMGLGMNEVMGRYFETVTASLARQKSRVLTATGVRPAGQRPAPRFPLHGSFPVGLEKPLELRAYAETFGGAKLDPGTRFLLEHLDLPDTAGRAVDLGCGNGTIAGFMRAEVPAAHGACLGPVGIRRGLDRGNRRGQRRGRPRGPGAGRRAGLAARMPPRNSWCSTRRSTWETPCTRGSR